MAEGKGILKIATDKRQFTSGLPFAQLQFAVNMIVQFSPWVNSFEKVGQGGLESFTPCHL